MGGKLDFTDLELPALTCDLCGGKLIEGHPNGVYPPFDR